MLSKNKIKTIRSLSLKKHREELGLFIVEGEKMCKELLELNLNGAKCDYQIQEIFFTQEWLDKYEDLVSRFQGEKLLVKTVELEKLSQLKTANQVIAIVKIPPVEIPYYDEELVLLLDKIQDPGNMGTIIRTAEWFGIKYIICSSDSVDLYNSKVVQSTMGAMFNVDILYFDIVQAIKNLKKHHPLKPVYGAALDGRNIYDTPLSQNACIVMGNESKGIRPEVREMVTKTIKIPQIGKSESLNVASATAVICSEFKRNL
ncbi:MAG: TrmH family RNA methyltransferase [Salibacteraceae bacterium]